MASHSAVLGRGRILLMAAVCGGSVANLYYCQPLLAILAHSFGVGAARIGLVPMLTQIGYALGLLFFVPLGDRVERRKLMLGMLFLLCLALAGAALAPTLSWFLAASLMIGALSSIAQQMVPLAAQLAPPEMRGRVVGTVISGLLIGILLARTVSGIIGIHAGWRLMFWLAAALIAVLAASLAIGLPPCPPTVRLPYTRLLVSLGTLARTQPVLRNAALIGGLLFGAFSVFWSTLTLLLAGPPFHLGSDVAGAFGLVGAAGALAAPLAGRVADRGGPRRVLWLALACVLLSFAVFAAGGHSLWGLVAGVVLLDLGVQGGHTANQSRIFALLPEARSRLNSVYMVGYFLGGAGGSLLGSIAWAQGGWPAVCLTGGALAVAALVAHVAGGRAGRTTAGAAL